MDPTSGRKPMKGFIGLHIGAGKYSKAKYSVYKSVMDLACSEGIKVLRTGGSALKAVTVATSILEDSKVTNAGSGSNLTWDGQVECDAGLMDGKTGHFGAVGALQQVRNPIQVAYRLCKDQSRLECGGLIRPCIMVGPGALAYAREKKAAQILDTADLICPAARRRYARSKARVLEMKPNSRAVCDNDSKCADDSVLPSTHADTSVVQSVDNSPGVSRVSATSKRPAESFKGAEIEVVKRKKVSPETCCEMPSTVDTVLVNTSIIKCDSEKSLEALDRNQVNIVNVTNLKSNKDRENEDREGGGEEREEIRGGGKEERGGGDNDRGEEKGCGGGKGEEDKEGEGRLCEEEEEIHLDTVGVVCVDLEGNLASSCSSGGIILKRSGRLGQACIRGSGCWAQNADPGAYKYGPAVSTSGPGEYLIRTCLAQEVARVFRGKVLPTPGIEEDVGSCNSVLLEKCMREEFLESPFLQGVEFPKLAGVIVLLTSPENNSPEEFLWAHSSHSFGVAYMSTNDKRSHTRMSALADTCTPGTSINVESVHC
ncbi:hypothetical protein M8J76_004200 [Diaphorina citri]|nr:hypothetical protein M8J76_004200 [Diaphorina citri]